MCGACPRLEDMSEAAFDDLTALAHGSLADA
jgi:hypothetical protein